MTVMVRDEADIIRPMIEHALAQGVDTLIVTDNGSVDGTAEILESFGDAIELRHDPVHRKQQHSVVTGMARDAYTRFGADWVINADADEFWLPRDPRATLKDIFSELPTALRTFTVPVHDMTGDPAMAGSGLQRLRYRDHRPDERMRQLGLRSHATPDAVHIGHADIEVAQGNHFVNIDQEGEVPPGLEVEVLHFPWRSWAQFEAKVRNSGRAYESNPDLQPSPNHHGMREYLRWKLGVLFPYYVLRHPDVDELAAGLESGELVEDDRVARTASSPVADEPIAPSTIANARHAGAMISAVESFERGRAEEFSTKYSEAVAAVEEGRRTIEALQARTKQLESRTKDLETQLEHIRSRRVLRAADWLTRGRASR